MASQYIAQGSLHSCTCVWKNQHSWSQCPGREDKGADVDIVITNSCSCFQPASKECGVLLALRAHNCVRSAPWIQDGTGL